MPQTVYDVGDPITSRLDIGVTPDGSTVVSVAVTAPDGTLVAVVGPTQVGTSSVWTAQWTGDLDGDYVAVWTVTGTGAGVQAKVYNVRALPSASDTRPVWTPFLSDVADYVPRLTIDTITPGSATEYGTFTGSTTPTDEQAHRLTDAAVAAVLGAVGTVDDTLHGLARVVAAIRAAASIQRAYPRDLTAIRGSDEASLADALDRRADAELARLITANTAAGQAQVPAAVLPVYSFPDPVSWGDSLL